MVALARWWSNLLAASRSPDRVFETHTRRIGIMTLTKIGNISLSKTKESHGQHWHLEKTLSTPNSYKLSLDCCLDGQTIADGMKGQRVLYQTNWRFLTVFFLFRLPDSMQSASNPVFNTPAYLPVTSVAYSVVHCCKCYHAKCNLSISI